MEVEVGSTTLSTAISLKVGRQTAKLAVSKSFSTIQEDQNFLKLEEKNTAITPKKCGFNDSLSSCSMWVAIAAESTRWCCLLGLTEPLDRVLVEHCMRLTQEIAKRFGKG